jgi:phage pi2 protein 07
MIINTNNIKEFSTDNIIFPSAFYPKEETNNWVKIYLKYKYPNGQISPLIIQTPEILSLGIYKLPSNNMIENLSFSFILYDKVERAEYEEGNFDKTKMEQLKLKFDEENKFIDVLTNITEYLKKNLKNNPAIVKKLPKTTKKNWEYNIKDIKILRKKLNEQGEEDPDCAPTVFAKINLQDNYRTNFYEVKDNQLIQIVNTKDIIERLQNKNVQCIYFGSNLCIPDLRKCSLSVDSVNPLLDDE